MWLQSCKHNVCVSLTFFRTNQQIQTKAMALLMALLQTAGDSDRKVPLLLFQPFMHFLFSTLVKLESVQMIRYFSLARCLPPGSTVHALHHQ